MLAMVRGFHTLLNPTDIWGRSKVEIIITLFPATAEDSFAESYPLSAK